MGIKTYKPKTPGLRQRSVLDFEEITQSKPEKSLLRPLRKTGGRNNHGHVTLRFRGGGHRRAYRIIDFKRTKDGIPAVVASIEYDPNRSSNIALLNYRDGEKRYIVAPQGLRPGDQVISGADADILPGNNLPMINIPLGTVIHNVELTRGKGGQLARSAGAAAPFYPRRPTMKALHQAANLPRFLPLAAASTAVMAQQSATEGHPAANTNPHASTTFRRHLKRVPTDGGDVPAVHRVDPVRPMDP